MPHSSVSVNGKRFGTVTSLINCIPSISLSAMLHMAQTFFVIIQILLTDYELVIDMFKRFSSSLRCITSLKSLRIFLTIDEHYCA